MDAATYLAVARTAGRYLDHYEVRPFELGEALPSTFGSAVYVVEDRLGRIRYVGSAWRTSGTGAVRGRFGHHLRTWWKYRLWDRVYVVPIKQEAARDVVLEIESLIASDLQPIDGDRHPKTRGIRLV